MPDQVVEANLPNAVAVVGQTDLDAGRLARAPHLRAIVNVESNFLPNIDYDRCFERGIHVLSTAPAFGQAVAEMALALALDLIRGVTAADRAMRQGTEQFGFAANQESFLLSALRSG
jgi:phosphoglycerate dehydrogenase-like enzyme